MVNDFGRGITHTSLGGGSPRRPEELVGRLGLGPKLQPCKGR